MVMTDKSLLTLKEIAEKLHINYRSLINYKNQFQEFVPGRFDGRNFMYLPDSLDFFQLMFALREEGYTFEMIRQILSQQIDPPNNVQLKEWVMEWVKPVK